MANIPINYGLKKDLDWLWLTGRLQESHCVPNALKQFILGFIECTNYGTTIVSRDELVLALSRRGQGSSRPVTNGHIEQLKKIGVIVDSEQIIDFRRYKQQTLVDIAAVISFFSDGNIDKPQHKTRGRPNGKALQIVIDNLDNPFLNTSNQETAGRMESLFTGVLDAGMRLSSNDNRKTIQCSYILGKNQKLRITTKTLSGDDDEIAMLSDLRIVRALNKMFREYLEREFGSIQEIQPELFYKLNQKFSFDLYDLITNELRLANTNTNREIIRRAIRRIRDTVFFVDPESADGFNERFDHMKTDDGEPLLQQGETKFQYITHFSAINELDQSNPQFAVNYVGRFYTVKFHDSVIANLLNPENSFIAHPGLTSERSGITQRFYNWCKAVIGVRDRNREYYDYVLDELWERVLPSARLDNFCRDFMIMINRSVINMEECPTKYPWLYSDNSQLAHVYGFYVWVSEDASLMREHRTRRHLRTRPRAKNYPLIRIWRNRDDIYIGDDSVHNVALRRQALELDLFDE